MCQFYVVLVVANSNYTYVHIMASLVVILFGLIIKNLCLIAFERAARIYRKVILSKDNYTTDLICELLFLSKS